MPAGMPRPSIFSRPVPLFALVGTLLWTINGLVIKVLGVRQRDLWRGFPDLPLLDGWTRWDAGWYARIAKSGYFYDPTLKTQSSVAFFPVYPLLMRAVSALTGDVLKAGILISLASGLLSTVLFHGFCRDRLDARELGLALPVLLFYPFAFFLFGAVYGDALFLSLALGAFAFLERDRPGAAAVLGMVATASRPVGLALFLGLLARQAERRGVFGTAGKIAAAAPLSARLPRALHVGLMCPADLWLLLVPLGLLAYAAYLGIAFGDPLAFSRAEAAPGWDHVGGVRSWLKIDLLDALFGRSWTGHTVLIAFHGLLTIAAYCLLPAVVRRFGLGYAIYALAVLGIPTLASHDLFGMGRYILAAFPVFAALAAVLVRRPRLKRVLLCAVLVLEIILAAAFGQWIYVS